MTRYAFAPEIALPRAFVIGDPIAHSKSPLIHNRWLKTYGLAGSYEAIHVKPGDLAGFIERMRSGEFAGGNVTIPHKETVIGLCDTLDAAARAIGAVNTLVRTAEGRVEGCNTDHYGFLANLDAGRPGWDEAGGRAVVLGAGGAARAVVHALLARGFSDVLILNRTLERAEALADEFGVTAAPLEHIALLAPQTGLLVNTTAVGMQATRFTDFDLAALLDALPSRALVTDIVYTPLETPLLAEARARSLATVDGLGMLLHQAVPGFEAWFGQRPEVTAQLRDEIVSALGQ